MESRKSRLLTVRSAVVISADELEEEDKILRQFGSQEMQQQQEKCVELDSMELRLVPSLSPACSFDRRIDESHASKKHQEKYDEYCIDPRSVPSISPASSIGQNMERNSTKPISKRPQEKSVELDSILPSISPALSVGHSAERTTPKNTIERCQDADWEPHKLKPTSRMASIFIANSDESTSPRSSRMMLDHMPKADSVGIHSISTAVVEDERHSFEDDTALQHRGISQILNWFKSVLGQINRTGVVTLKDIKLAAREYEVREIFFTMHYA